MAIPDLLWACPECHRDRGLRESRGDSRCAGCGAVFRRAEGAAIERVNADGGAVVRTAAEWLARLPSPESLVERADAGAPIRSAHVEARMMTGEGVVRQAGAYLNRYEVLGEPFDATLELWPQRMALRALAGGTPEGGRQGTQEGGRQGKPRRQAPEPWPFEEITALQASSSSLQIKPRGRPLASFRFHDDSVYLWELLVRAALRRYYQETGRGEIVEFQPRIIAAASP